MKIDFVSDVSCPWCVVGLKSLEAALVRVADEVQAELHFQPFELNPTLTSSGQDIDEHLMQKYGTTRQQLDRSSAALRDRGAELGFDFQMQKRTRIYNTFDAHRLLHWAQEHGRQPALKHALFEAYFTDGANPSDHEVLIGLARKVGLDPVQAREILSSDRYAADVRKQERIYQEHGIQAVPSVIIDDQYLIQGGQPVEVFERALRKIAQEKSPSTPSIR
jgi:predicted DsbA family dithiol-disulfide isomerase